MKAKISVIIPVYNRPDDLSRCLIGLKSQYHESILQCIIIDDASTDLGVKELAKQYEATYIRLRARNGSAYCKNIGILKAEGEFILFLDSDVEFISERTLTCMAELLRTRQDCGEVGGEAILGVDNKPKYIFGRNINLETGSSRCDYIPTNAITSVDIDKPFEFDYIPTSNCMVRRETALRIGGFDDTYSHLGEDKDFGYRVKKLGLRNLVTRDSVILHRLSVSGRPGSALRKQSRTQIRFYIRHFGFMAATKMVLRQEQDFLRGLFRPAKTLPSVDPAIRQFENYYKEAILKLPPHSHSLRGQLLRSTWLFWESYLWNIINCKARYKLGSSRLPIHIE